MNIRSLIPRSPSDRKWYDDFVQKYGQKKMDKWIDYVYKGMDKLQQYGDNMIISDWCPDEHLPIFIPIVHCYMTSVTDREILFNNDYTKIILYIVS